MASYSDITSRDMQANLTRLATVLDKGLDAKIDKKKVKIHKSKSDAALQERIPLPNSVIDEWDLVPQPKPRPKTPRVSTSGLTKSVIGGTPITYEQALEMRKVLHGSGTHVFSTEWKKCGLSFQPTETPYPYGLHTQRNGSRGVIICVQAHLLRHLIFKYETQDEILGKNPESLASRLDETKRSKVDPAVLQPTNTMKKEAIVMAISSILWSAGERRTAVVALPGEREAFKASPLYRYDGITEKLHLFDFTSFEDLKMFIKRYLTYFEGEATNGVILFLYSMILSRTVPKIYEDTGEDKPQLLTAMEECTRAMINLLLSGAAVNHLHNGNLVYDDEGEALTKPIKGIAERGDVGFMFFHREEDPKERTQVGSMLKTPKFPIWVTQINRVNFGVLFSLSRDLVSDWRQEHRFTLHYYTGLPTQSKAVRLTVDTRFGRKGRARTARSRREEEKKIPPVEQCILAKWPGCEVDWNGILPFI